MPTEKNMDMLEMIVKAFSNEGDIVMDAFFGSGTTLVAAQKLNRYFVGMDASEQAIKICQERLSNYDLIVTDKSP